MQCITHNQEGPKTRQIISKVMLSHFSVLQGWVVSICVVHPLAQVTATNHILLSVPFWFSLACHHPVKKKLQTLVMVTSGPDWDGERFFF